MSAVQRIASYLFLFLVVVGGGVSLDALSDPRAPAAEGAAVEPVAHERGRAFVFVIDSLRYETAMDPTTMPNLAALRAKGTFARVTPSNDAVTVPSLRAAFTGRENTKLLGFVTNFLKRRAGVRSVFTDLAGARRRAAAFSDDAFTQFGADAVDTFSNGDDGPTEVRDQNATISKALRVYSSAHYDLVAMHITYTDHVAHEDGVGSPSYRERFHAADAMVAAMDRAVPENETLVVMGDHGHDEKGRHSFGLDVPTFAVYRGVRFQRAMDLGTVPIREHRYLLGWALGLPLPSDYDGPRHPAALGSHGQLPRDYAAVSKAAGSSAQQESRRSVYAATAFDLVAAFLVWTFVTGPLAVSPPAALLGVAWASTIPRFAAPGSLFGALAGIVASLGCLAWVAVRDRYAPVPDSAGGASHAGAPTTPLAFGSRAPFLFAAAALTLWGIGFLFPAIRPTFHEPTYQRLALFWTVAWGAAVALIRNTERARYGAVLLLLPLFFFVPTVYRYGSAAAMAPAWMGMSLCLLAAAGRVALAVVAPVILLLAPFLAVDASDYRFDEWVLYPSNQSAVLWVLGAFVAKALLLWRWDFSTRLRTVAIALTMSMVVFERTRLFRLEEACALVVLGYAAWRFWDRRRSVGSESTSSALSPEEQMAWIAGLLIAHHALTRVEPEAYLWRDILLGAVLLSGKAAKEFVPERSRGIAHAVLLFFSLMATGWVTFAWTVHRLEWGFLYDWFTAPFVERHVAFFLPLILARYLLPLIVARLVLGAELGRDARYPVREVWLLAGWKIASLFLITVGIAATSSTTEIYLEGAEETAIAGVLAAGLL